MTCDRKHGADERNRTADLLITNQLLYQLSYVGPIKNNRCMSLQQNSAARV